MNATPPLSDAERARLAHRALRLKESGYDSDRALKDLASTVENVPDDSAGRQGNAMGRVGGHPLGLIARRVLHTMDASAPGPTAPEEVERLMNRDDLLSIWQEWDDAVTANLEATLSDAELKRWRKSVADDEKAAAESYDAMGIEPPSPFGHGRLLEGAANAFYDLGREGFAAGEIAWTATPVFKVVLIDSADYTVNLATHKFLSSVAAAGREETSAALANKTNALGVLDADDTSLPAAAGDVCEAMAIYMSSALAGGADVADTAQRLVIYIDSYTGLPVTLNGGAVNVAWDSGANRIGKL